MGTLVIAVAGPLLIIFVAVMDLRVEQTRQATPGEFIHDWAKGHPYLAALVAGFVGAFAAHIFWYTLSTY